MRRTILAVLLVSAALAGCLGQAEDLLPADEDPPDSDDPETNRDDGNQTRGGGNETNSSEEDQDQGNETDGGDGDGSGGQGNESARRDPGWPEPSQAAVRPGAKIASACTANYVFSNADNTSLYVGTAAHCFDEGDTGKQVPIADGAAHGTLVYHSVAAMDRVNESSEAARYWNDFALVRVDDRSRGEVHPAVQRYGGPSGLVADAAFGDRVLTYGNSDLRDGADDMDPREGYVTGSSPWHVDVHLHAPSIPGDSGSPVVTADGEALGVLITLEVTPKPGSNDALKVSRAVEYMEAHGGPDVRLETWTQFSDGLGL